MKTNIYFCNNFNIFFSRSFFDKIMQQIKGASYLQPRLLNTFFLSFTLTSYADLCVIEYVSTCLLLNFMYSPYASVRGNQDVADTREKRGQTGMPDVCTYMYIHIHIYMYGILSAAVDYRISER